MTYQEFVETQFESVLNLGLSYEQLNSECYKYALKQMLGVYAEAYEFDGYEIKFWEKDFHSKGQKNKNHFQGREIWKTILGSQTAYNFCQKIEKGNLSLDKYPKAEQPYYEHIEPRSLTYERLINLSGKASVNKAKIHDIFSNSKIIILSREESKFLDSKEYNRFNEQDIQLINQWYKDHDITKDIMNEALESINKAGTTKDGGTAYARFAHLCTSGVVFEWGCDPNPYPGKKQIQLFNDFIGCKNRRIV